MTATQVGHFCVLRVTSSWQLMARNASNAVAVAYTQVGYPADFNMSGRTAKNCTCTSPFASIKARYARYLWSRNTARYMALDEGRAGSAAASPVGAGTSFRGSTKAAI